MFDYLNNHIGIMEAGLRASVVRNDVYMHNLANVDTPGFKQKSVKFEEILASELKLQESEFLKDFSGIQPVIYTKNMGYSYRMDGNNIDVEEQMAMLYQNQMRFEVMTSGVMNSFKRINLAVSK